MKVFTVLLLVCCFSCSEDQVNYSENMTDKPNSEMVFDKVKWQTKDGANYPYRDKMLNALVYNDSIRSLSGTEILNLLGAPSYYRDNENYLYYVVKQKRFLSWPLHTKALVIKLESDNTIDWIKIYK